MSVKPYGFGLALLLVGMVAVQTAQQASTLPVVACIDILRQAVVVTVKNERRQVLNALEERYYTPRAMNQMSIRRDRPGIRTVSVQRRWYRPATVRGIRVEENECGPVRPTPITIQLKPTSDASRIRDSQSFQPYQTGFWSASDRTIGGM